MFDTLMRRMPFSATHSVRPSQKDGMFVLSDFFSMFKGPSIGGVTDGPLANVYLLQCQSRQLMHCDTLKQDNDSTVRGDGGGRVGEVRAGTTSPMPEHKGFKLQ